jgi:hypothetical protein
MIKYVSPTGGVTWTPEGERVTHDGFYTFAYRMPGYWTVGASHIAVVGELGRVEHIDYCTPTELPNARRRALRAARRIMAEES